MEGKKISFGFLKTKKQDKPVTAEKKEYIECVEEKAIKVVGGGEVIEERKPLVIPMKPNTLITAEKLKQIAEKVENFDEPQVKIEKEETTTVPDNETLDQMAVRELVEEAKKIKKEVETDKLVVPINAKPVMDGQAEASLEDYESVPVQDFGMAMLRGMGWTPGKDHARTRRVSKRQLDLLWEYLNTHKDIAVAFNRSLQAKEYSKEKWHELAQILNSQDDGVHKDWKGWSKYWVDYKAKLKKRAFALRSSQDRSGGGPSTVPPFSEIENKFLQILGEDYSQGLHGVQLEPFAENSQNDTMNFEVSPSIVHIFHNQEIPATETEQNPHCVPDWASDACSSELTSSQSPESLRRCPCGRERSPQPLKPTGSQPLQTPDFPRPLQTPNFPQPLQNPKFPQPLQTPDSPRPLQTPDSPRPLQTPDSPRPLQTPDSPRPLQPTRSVRRRRRLSQKAVRRALVRSSQQKAESARRSALALERIAQGVRNGVDILRNIERSKYKQPQLRPKGLGLGADKVIKEKEKNKTKDKEEELSIVKNSFVKITTGKYNGLYGKVVSLDEDNGRVMVEITMRKETISLSEFMMQAVTKAEFDKQSKVINSESYEEYKKKETLNSSKGYNSTKTEETRKGETSSKKSNDTREKESTEKRENKRNQDEKYSNGSNKSKEKERYRKESSSSEEERSQHRKKNKKKYSSNESLSSESDHKYKSLDRRRDSSSDSSDRKNRKKEKSHKSKSSKEKRDIDKKRKGKKKKRDRDRSPNYKKHRK